MDWDGNELLLSDILGTEEDLIYRDLEEEVDKELLKKAMNLIRPIVPMDIKSSTPTPVLSNFLAIYTTSLSISECGKSFRKASLPDNGRDCSEKKWAGVSETAGCNWFG